MVVAMPQRRKVQPSTYWGLSKRALECLKCLAMPQNAFDTLETLESLAKCWRFCFACTIKAHKGTTKGRMMYSELALTTCLQNAPSKM